MSSFKYAVGETIGRLCDYIPNPSHQRLREIAVRHGLDWLLYLFHRESQNHRINYTINKKQISISNLNEYGMNQKR